MRSLNTASSFSDIPVWAQAEMTKIAATGIVNGYTDGKLGAKDQVTLEQLTALVKRMVALKGTNPRDDYYEFVNKKWLNASTIDAGEMTNGAFNELDKQNQERIKDMLQEVVKDTHAKGSVEQKIADFYTNAQDLKHRNALGIKPIAPYIASLNQASTIQEVMNVGLKMEKELGFGSILSFGIMADAKKVTLMHYIMQV